MPTTPDRAGRAPPADRFSAAIRFAAIAAAAAGLPGSVCPPIDIAALLIIWGRLTREIVLASGHPDNTRFRVKLVASIAASATLYLGGCKVFTSLLHLIPGPGTVTAAASNVVLNYIYTKRLGRFLAQQFSQPDLNFQAIASRFAQSAFQIFGFPDAEEIEAAKDALAAHAAGSSYTTLDVSGLQHSSDAVHPLDPACTAAHNRIRFTGGQP